MKYLIRDKGNNCYAQNNSTAVYSSSIGTAICDKLPHYIPEEGDCDSEVIKSDNPEFIKILRDEASNLDREIRNLEDRLRNRKENFDLIVKALNEI